MERHANKGARIGLVVPAFDEAPRIGAVLSVVTKARFFDRIVVVDDGSKDTTAQAADRYPVDAVVRHETNRGKGAAIQTGLEALGPMEIVVMLDADLIGLRPDHLRALVEPILEDHSVGMSVGRFVKGRFSVDMQQKWFAILNGQRALSAPFINHLPDLTWSRFGIEVLLTRYAKDRQVPVAQPLLEGITHYPKEEKFGFRRGFPARVNMYKECLAAHATYHRRVPGSLRNRVLNIERQWRRWLEQHAPYNLAAVEASPSLDTN